MNDRQLHAGTGADIPGWDDLVAAGRVDAPRPEVVAAARGALREAVEAEARAIAPGAAPAEDRSGGRLGVRVLRRPGRSALSPFARTGRRVLLTAAAAAVAAVVTVTSLGSGHPAPAPATAATFLNDVADVMPATAAGQNAPYWEVDALRTVANGQRGEIRSYSAHEAGRTNQLKVVSPVTEDKVSRGPGRYSVGTSNLTWDELVKEVPSNEDALSKYLFRYADPGEGSSSEAVFTSIGDLLNSPATPAQRKALYQVAAGLPGVRLAGRATDGLGRTGTAVERSDGRVVVRYVIDPSDGRLLETVVLTVHALPAVPPSAKQRQHEDYSGGVGAGFAADGSRPAMRAGQVVLRTTYRTVGAVNSVS